MFVQCKQTLQRYNDNNVDNLTSQQLFVKKTSLNFCYCHTVADKFGSLPIGNAFFHFRPLTLSENLTKIAQKIDFSKSVGEDIKKEQSENGEKSEDDSKDSTSYQSSLWPWDSVRSKLRFAFVIKKVYVFFLYIL